MGIDLSLAPDSNTLSWAVSFGAEKYTLMRHKYGEDPLPIAETTATTFTDSGLTNPKSYIYSVVAVNQSGKNLASEEVSGTFGVAPPPLRNR
jgi:hypothetical protein